MYIYIYTIFKCLMSETELNHTLTIVNKINPRVADYTEALKIAIRDKSLNLSSLCLGTWLLVN